MIEEDYPEKPSGFLLGKEFIIVLVIVFSGVSFTLGYFVGKNAAGPAASSLHAAEGIAQQNRQDPPPVSPVQVPAQPGALHLPCSLPRKYPLRLHPRLPCRNGVDGKDAGSVPQEQLKTVSQQKHLSRSRPIGVRKKLLPERHRIPG